MDIALLCFLGSILLMLLFLFVEQRRGSQGLEEIAALLRKIAKELEKDFEFPELRVALEGEPEKVAAKHGEGVVKGAKPFPGSGHCVLCTKALEGDGVVSTVGQRLYHRGCWVKVSAEASA